MPLKKTFPKLVEEGEKYENENDFFITKKHKDTINFITFSFDEKFIAVCTVDNCIQIWDIFYRKKIISFFVPQGSLGFISFSLNSKFIIFTIQEKIKIYNIKTGKEIFNFLNVKTLSISPNGKFIASVRYNQMEIWNIKSGERIDIFSCDCEISAISFSPNGNFLVLGLKDRVIELWSIKKRKKILSMSGHFDEIVSIAFSPNGKFIVSASLDRTIKIWDIKLKNEIISFFKDSNSIHSVSFSANGEFLISLLTDKTVNIWDLEEKKQIFFFDSANPLSSIKAISFNLKFIVLGVEKQIVSMWDFQFKKELISFLAHLSPLSCVAVSRNARFIVSGYWNLFYNSNSLKVWDNQNLTQIFSFSKYSSTIYSVSISPDGKIIVVAFRDNFIRVWNVENRYLIFSFKAHSQYISCVKILSDNDLIISASADKTVKVWSIKKKKEIVVFLGHTSYVTNLDICNNQNLIVSSSGDKTVKVWDIKAKKLIASFYGNNSSIYSVAISEDGKFVVSGDRMIRVWDIKAEKEIASFRDYSTFITSLKISKNQKFIISASGNRVKIWKTGELNQLANKNLFNKKLFKDTKEFLLKSWVNSLDISLDDKELIVGLADGSIQTFDLTNFLIKNSYIGGANGCWLILNKKEKKFYRGDDGKFLLNQKKEFIPPQSFAKNLKISLLEKITATHQSGGKIVMNVKNLDNKNIAYLIKFSCDSSYITFYPNLIYKILPNQDYKIALKFSLNASKNLSKPHIYKTTLKVWTAEELIEKKEIELHIHSAKIEFLRAKIYKDTINISILNSGDEVIEDLKIKLFGEIQTIKKISPQEIVQKAFILKNDVEYISFEIYKDRISGFYWSFKNKKVLKESIRVKRIIKNPKIIFESEWNELKNIKNEFLRADKFELLGIKPYLFDKMVEFVESGYDEKAKIFADFLDAEVRIEGKFYRIILPNTFALNIKHFLLSFPERKSEIDIVVELIDLYDKVFVIAKDKTIQNKIAKIAKNRSNLLIAPLSSELLKFMLGDEKIDNLVKILSQYLTLKDISPYKIAGGVEKESSFYGRVEILSHIVNRNLTNYLIVGARQLGKSSLLEAIKRRYSKSLKIKVYLITMQNDDIMSELALCLGIKNNLELIIKQIYKSPQKIVFLIDEVDEFISKDIKEGYKTTTLFRKLSQENRAYFIMAGFWELYEAVFGDYFSPLKNFGEVIRVEALEYEACRDLMIKPMEKIGVSYENEKIIDEVIYKSGQRANLIAIICNEFLKELKGKIITQNLLQKILEEGNLGDYVSLNYIKNKIDRLIIFATIELENWSLDDIEEKFEENELFIDSRELETALSRLKISFVIKQKKTFYNYTIPLFKESVRELTKDMDKKLKREIKKFKM